jgi:hypothetical protein
LENRLKTASEPFVSSLEGGIKACFGMFLGLAYESRFKTAWMPFLPQKMA